MFCSLSPSERMTVSTQEVIQLLADAMSVDHRIASQWQENSLLYGALPELDSMSVVAVFAAIEDQYNVRIEQDDINLNIFHSIGTVKTFINSLISP